MPITNGIGHGEHTPLKHDHLAGILTMHLGICRGMYSKGWLSRWWYFDMNAGDGQGSPAVAWHVMHKVQQSFAWQLVLTEHNKTTFNALHCRYDRLPGIICYHADNREIATIHARDLTGRDYGVVFHDPNGNEIDLEMLRAFKNTRLDVVIYYSATGNKRLDTAFQGRRGVRLGRIVARDIKEHWLIRRPVSQHQWTMLIGSNWDQFPTWERQGFYRLHSSAGQEIYDRLHNTARERRDRNPRLEGFSTPPYRTYAEYLKHPRFLEIRARVMQRAGGICERCHGRHASEVHHLCYPKWGTFDVPENLIAICHPCHCEIHGKEN